jgi:hypothetical protein
MMKYGMRTQDEFSFHGKSRANIKLSQVFRKSLEIARLSIFVRLILHNDTHIKTTKTFNLSVKGGEL